MTDLLKTPEFWMAVSAILPLITLFIPAPYRPILEIIGRIIAAMPKKTVEAPAVQHPLPKLRESPADVMREAEARFKERGGQ